MENVSFKVAWRLFCSPSCALCSCLPPLGSGGYCMWLILHWNAPYSPRLSFPLLDRMTNPQPWSSKVHVRDKMTADGQKPADADGEIWLTLGCFCTIPDRGFQLHVIFKCSWKLFWWLSSFLVQREAHTEAHTRVGGGRGGMVRQQANSRCF